MITFPFGFLGTAAGGGLPVTTDLWGHWDAAEGITMDGSNNISQWDDQSGNGRNFTQATGADQPLFVADVGADLNNLPAVSFPSGGASPDWMQIAGTAFYESGDSGKYTLFMVYTDLTGSSWGTLYDSQYDRSPATDPQYAKFMGYKASSTLRRYGWSQTTFQGNVYEYSWGFNDANPHIVGNTFHAARSASAPYTTFGADIDNGSETCYPSLCQGSAATIGAAVADYFYLNFAQNNPVVNYGIQYKLAEFILYNDALSNADFNTMESYLNTKYAVY